MVNGWEQLSGLYPFGDGSIDYIFNPYRTASNQLGLHFVSDNSVNKKGFLIEYRVGKSFAYSIFHIIEKLYFCSKVKLKSI